MQTSAGKVLSFIFWDAQAILFIDYLEKSRTINSEYSIGLLVCLKEETAKKTTINEEVKSALSPKQCIVSQVNCNDEKITWITLQIASAPILSSRCGPQQLLAVCRSQKNTPGKVLASVYHSRRRLSMNYVKFGRKVALLGRPETYQVMCYIKYIQIHMHTHIHTHYTHTQRMFCLHMSISLCLGPSVHTHTHIYIYIYIYIYIHSKG